MSGTLEYEAAAIDSISNAVGGASEIGRGQIRAIKWSSLHYGVVSTLRKINLHNSLASRCRMYIIDHLFANDFQIFNSDGKELQMTNEYRKFFYKRYRSFGMAAIDCIMTMGVIPVVMPQHRNGHHYPVVPADDTYIIQVGYALDTEKRYYRVWRPKIYKLTGKNDAANSQISGNMGMFLGGFAPNFHGTGSMGMDLHRGIGGFGGVMGSATGMAGIGGVHENWFIDETVSIMDGFGYDPGVRGEINSPLKSILEDFTFTNTLADRMLTAEYLMTEPIHLLQYHKDQDPDQKIDLSGGKALINYDADEIHIENREGMELTQNQINALSKQTNLIRQAISEKITSDGLFRANQQEKEGIRTTNNQIRFPKGLEYVKGEGQERHVGNKYVPIRQLFDDNLSALYGIPLAIMRNVGNLRGNQSEQTNIFRQTLKKYAKLVGEIITIAFNEAYEGEELKLEDNVFKRKAVTDDTEFTKLRIRTRDGMNVEILTDDTPSLPAPDDKAAMFRNAAQVNLGSEGNSASRPVDPIKAMQIEIEKLKEKNRNYKRKLHENERGESKNDGDNENDNGDSGATGSKKRRKIGYSSQSKKGRSKNLASGKGGNDVGVIIKIDITSFMDAKGLKHAFDIGALDLEQYQRLWKNRLDIGQFNLKKQSQTAEKILLETLRTVGSAPPREDLMEPESENLGQMAKSFEKDKKIPPGILVDIAQHQGNVEEINDEMNKEKAKQKSKEEAGAKKSKTEKKSKAVK